MPLDGIVSGCYSQISSSTELGDLILCSHTEPESQSKAKAGECWESLMCNFPIKLMLQLENENLQVMVTTETPFLILNKRKIILVETIKYMRLAVENEDFIFHFVHKNCYE